MNSTATRSPESHAARLEVIFEVLDVFAHDLSNPLQSLIVLTELALEDAQPGSEDELRCNQTLEAAERMRTLVTGLAGLTRGTEGPRQLRTAVDRFAEILSRRWERHRIELQIDLGAAEHMASPPELDTALLSLGLGAVAAAGELGGPAFRLSVRVQEAKPGDGADCVLQIVLVHRDPQSGDKEVPLDEKYLRRSADLLQGSGVRLETNGAKVSLEFSYEAVR
ncbi:MAG: hypothetical protein JKY37_06370 [Nannocystaceae bacterium]|nr:hypothetical protein [Nannocystaceae bacterium]